MNRRRHAPEFSISDVLQSSLLGAATGPLAAGIAARPGLTGATSALAEGLFGVDVAILSGIGNASQ